MPDAPRPDRLARLARAVDLYLAHDPADAELLAAHPELADLLRPLLAPDAAQPVLGRTLGGHRLLREIGRGGMGVVYEALDLALDRKVALKVLPSHLLPDAKRIVRFKREAQLLAGLSHPHVVKVHTVGSEGECHFFAMELVDGLPIEPGPAARVVPKIAAIADALAHVHARGLVHRDVKPGNILVRRDGSPVLTDFGLAHADDLPAMTRSGEFAGTPYYVSPEQARGEAVDARSDVFSLGATLYEVLTGRRPFAAESTAAVLQRIQHEEVLSPDQLDPRLAPDLCAIVLKALEKEPQDRYAGAAEFAADLHAFLDYRPVLARRAPASRRIWRFVRREPWKAALMATIAAAVPVVAGLSGYLFASKQAIAVGSKQIELDAQEQLLADGWSELVNGDATRADACFGGVLARDPEHVDAMVGRALALRRRGRAAEGIALLEAGAALGQRDPALGRARAWLLEDSGQHDAAKTLEQELGGPKSAGDLFVSACREFVTNETRDADRDRRALELMHRAILGSERPRPLFFQQWAGIALQLQDERTLRRCVEAMKALWPDSARTWLTAGRALLLSDAKAAAAALARAAALEPAAEQVHLYHGLAQEAAGELDGAEASYRKAIAILPISIASYSLGELLVRRERFAAAVPVLRACCAQRPRFAPGQVELAKALAGTGALAEARACLERARELPKDPTLEAEISELLPTLGGK